MLLNHIWRKIPSGNHAFMISSDSPLMLFNHEGFSMLGMSCLFQRPHIHIEHIQRQHTHMYKETLFYFIKYAPETQLLMDGATTMNNKIR